MFDGQLDCRKMREADWNGTPDGISNQSDCKGVVMAKSNANKLFSEFKSAKDFDAAVEKEIEKGVKKHNRRIKKSNSTVLEWAGKRLYQRIEDAKPERQKAKRDRCRERYANDPEYRQKMKDRQKQVYQSDPDYRRSSIERATAHNRKNAGKRNARLRERYATDPDYRFAVDMRRHIARAFKGKLKPLACEQLLGVSLSEAKQKIESQFSDGMSWDNIGEWHIDHWYPLNKVDRSIPAQCVAVCNIENLQPMWGPENSEKHAKVTPEAKANFLRLVKHYEHLAAQKERITCNQH